MLPPRRPSRPPEETEVDVEPALVLPLWRGIRAEPVELPMGAARVVAARARVARRKRMVVVRLEVSGRIADSDQVLFSPTCYCGRRWGHGSLKRVI